MFKEAKMNPIKLITNQFFKSKDDKWTTPNPQDPIKAPAQLEENIGSIEMALVEAFRNHECKQNNCDICKAKARDYFDLDFIITHGPGIYPVINFVNQLIFACDLIVKDADGETTNEADTKKLTTFLQDKNFMNVNNLVTLQSASFNSLAYGESLLRYTEDGLVSYPVSQYVVGVEKNSRRGIRRALYYVVDISKNYPDFKDLITPPDSLLDENGELIPNFADAMFTDQSNQDKFVVTFQEGIQLRYTNDSHYYATSPLLYDRYRINALLSGYRSMINDMSYDNYGKALAYIKPDIDVPGLLGMNEQQFKANLKDNQDKAKKIVDKALKTAADIHSSTSRNVFGSINGQIFDKIDQLKGTVDMSKYLDFLNQGIAYAAVTYQINPRLIDSEAGLGQNLQPLLRLTYDNTINSIQRKFASQFTQLFKDAGLISDSQSIAFDPRDLDDPEQNAKIQKIVSETAKNLAAAGVDIGQVHKYISNNDIELATEDIGGERYIDRSLTLIGEPNASQE